MLEPCRHQFHGHCVERWLNKDKVCPVCWIPIQAHRPLGPQFQPNSHASGNSSITPTMTNGLFSKPPTAADINEPIPTSQMRKGKWTTEESAYCDRLIEEFKKGNLPLAEGTTLRTFLSKLLNCDPMRISKKYTGDQCIGKIIFRRSEDEVPNETLENIRKELAELEKTYLEREQYNQRRREKRLESELSRDKNRFLAARTLGYQQISTAPIGPISHFSGGTTLIPTQPMMTQQQQQAQQSHLQSHYPYHSVGLPLQQMRQPQQQQLQPSRQQPHHAPPPQQQQPQQPQQPQIKESQVVIKSHNSNPTGQPQDQQNTSSSCQNSEKADAQSQASDSSSSEFPRISSIDSFSCLFPRVASIDNFQFPGGSQPNSYPNSLSELPSQNNTRPPSSEGMSKSNSISDGLSDYFPRIQSLEQLSNLLQEHAPSSPKFKTESSNDNGKNTSIESTLTVKVKNETKKIEVDERKMSPEAAGHSNKQLDAMQAPKPLNKVPRSASGIFPRAPSMDKLPRVSSLDKGLDKLPRISSMDKLPPVPPMDKFPRVPSMDKFPRVNSNSDMLSSFGSSDNLSAFPSFTNLAGLSTCASYDKLNTLGSLASNNGAKGNFPRNSSIEDILSLVASSESTFGGLSNSNSHLQLNTLAASNEENNTTIVGGIVSGKRRLDNENHSETFKRNKA
jgi:hypothetical protein